MDYSNVIPPKSMKVNRVFSIIKDFVNKIKSSKSEISKSPIDIIVDATIEIFMMMTQIEISLGEEYEDNGRNLAIKIGITGKLQEELLFVIKESFAIEVVKKMVGMEIEEVDSFVTSALNEIVNIISGHALKGFEDNGLICDITTPELIENEDVFNGKRSTFFESAAGKFKMLTTFS